jgi:hypothetical protein
MQKLNFRRLLNPVILSPEHSSLKSRYTENMNAGILFSIGYLVLEKATAH